jgi:tetratricopeptide (TPR) repeat protein
LTEAGSQANPSPSPYKAGGKPPTNNRYSSSQAIGGAPSLFASPVPELFHAPDTFIRIPSPHNIMENDSQIGAAARRQTAPPNMSTAAATAAAEALRKSSSAFPKTPFDRSQEATGAPNTAPDTADTAETLIKKKTRNSATPNLDPTSPMFNVDLSRKPDSTKVNGKRGSTTRKGSNNNSYGFTKTTTNSNFPFGLDEIKEAGTDDTAPTESESPSNGSTLSMDTSPFLSPPSVEQKQSMYSNTGAEISQGFNATAQFSLGVGGKQSQAGATVKSRTKRKDNKGRRAQFHRSQSAHVSGPSQSTFDLNHNRTNQAEALARTRTEIAALKDRGKAFYGAAKYKESIRVYSQAIEKFKLELFAHVPAKDLLAVLLSNRAAALLMVGAYESAAEDSRNGIHFVTDPRNKNADFASPDANPALRPKLYTRMGRSYLKLGKVDDADRAFSEAIESAKVMQDFQRRQNVVEMHDGSGLDQIKTDSILGQSDVLQLRKLLGKINELQGQRSVQPRSARDQAMESLGLVKIALKTANGSYELHETKVKLLAELKRWREVASHCERFAVSNVSFDGCLINDLSSKNPFPNVPIAKRLRPDYFGDTKEDELKGAEMKLDRNSASEAILRLPYSMMPYYLRSLRLNERYYIAENCISALDKLARERAATSGESFYSHLLWLPEEREKLRRTKNERELGDNMFSNAEYEKAALRYAECLIIDSGSNQNCAGGRLHAILHCNRAACFMATKRYREAMNECTSALRIYPRYLKALLRRARCYSRLDRTRESESDYKYWLEIVNHSREGKSNPVLGDCVFDGPHTVKDKEMNDVQAELSDLLEAKARAEAEERVRQARNNYHEQSRKQQYHYNNNTNSGSNHNRKKSPAHEDAHRRRENFYSSQNSSRRWDSFKDRSQNGGQEKPKSRKTKKDDYGYKVQSSPRDNNDHYSSLGIDRRATAEEIKKAYKKMALKYHPDKNKDNATAAENFLRIKDAYETLKDPSARRKYDSKSRRGRY